MFAQVFIASSKKDSVWRKRLTTMLAPLVQLGLSAWDETHVQPGECRQQVIDAALAEARVAVLLVSAEFLASEFLGQHLAETLATAHRDKGLRILLVTVRPCLWRDTALAAYEPMCEADSPLNTLLDADAALAQICMRIKDAAALASPYSREFPKCNPYRGLSAFQTEDSQLFFGRDALTQDLCKQFQALFDKPSATRLLTILGPSGSGKSSVARAGLLAALARSSVAGAPPLRTATFKPGVRPIESMARALVPLLPTESAVLPASRILATEELLRNAVTPTHGLRRFAADLLHISDCPLVLLVDQFEEVYTLCTDSKERDAFIGLLLHAASDSACHVAVLLTLRSDFLGETQRYSRSLNRLIAAQSVLVPALSSEELRDVIAKPAAYAGRAIDDTTVELLLAEARDSQGALPLLEFALTRIWEGMASGETPGATLRRLGGVGGALAGEAQKVYTSLSTSAQNTARRALVRLVQFGEGTRDTRRRAPIAELCGHGETCGTVLSVLRRFAAANTRLVTLASDDAEAVAEVTHEALFDNWTELRSWIDESRDERRFQDRVSEAARLWQKDHRPAGRLWRPPDLDLLCDYKLRRPQELGTLQEEFLDAAVRRRRQERWLSAGAVLAIMALVLIAAVIYVTKERQLVQQLHHKLLDYYVEQGRKELFANGNQSAGLLWLHRAQAEGSQDAALPELLRSAISSVDSTSAVLIGHRDSVVSATFSSTGQRIVTASRDNTARLWESPSGRLIAELKGHREVVYNATFSLDGRRIVTASTDNTARVWESVDGRLVAELKGHFSFVTSATFSPDGSRIVTASADRTARVWNSANGQLVAELKGHGSYVASAMFSPDGIRVVTASGDRTARVWDSASGRLLAELKGHLSYVTSAAFSPNGRHIVTASSDKTARIWESVGGQLVVELQGHRDMLAGAVFSPDGRRLVTASGDNTARVWNSANGQLVAELKGHGDIVNSALFSPDGRRIVTASADKTARIWDSEDGRLLTSLHGHGSLVHSATFSHDGRHIVTASGDNTARIWKATDSRLVAELNGHGSGVTSAVFSPDGRCIVTTGRDATARVWETADGRLLTQLSGHGDVISGAMFSSDGRRIVTASSDHTARVWDSASGHLLAELKGHLALVTSATFSPGDQRIVTASDDKTARVWDSASGHLLAELKGHEGYVKTATFSPDSRYIVTASTDKTARIWDATSGRLLAELKGHEDGVNSAKFSPDGRRIVTASDDRTARVWDFANGQIVALAKLKGHAQYVTSAKFSPDGRRIITASNDKTARVWDAESGILLAELQGHGSYITSAAFSPDGNRIVTASGDQSACVWEPASGRLLAELKGHRSIVNSATFSPDGHRLVTASWDNTARIWDLSPETRTPEQLAQLIRCYVSASFEQAGKNFIVFRLPTPAACQPDFHHP